jgi:hypothetical protein
VQNIFKAAGTFTAVMTTFRAQWLHLPKATTTGSAQEMDEDTGVILNCKDNEPSWEDSAMSPPSKVNSKTKKHLRGSLAHLSDEERV